MSTPDDQLVVEGLVAGESAGGEFITEVHDDTKDKEVLSLMIYGGLFCSRQLK